MVRASEIQFEIKGIGTVLSHNRLAVPPNQREYGWEDEHVKDLLSDFANAIADSSPYFLGTIVLTAGQDGLPEVADGQQRLATTTILLAAIRDYFFHRDDRERVEAVGYSLRTIDIATTDRVPRLRLNIDDHEFFNKFVLADPDSPERQVKPSKHSHELIRHACELAAGRIREMASIYGDDNLTDRLLQWLGFIADDAQVIVLRVPSAVDAFKMFETLNDRGLKASQADLVKNHLFAQAGQRMAEAHSKWSAMVAVLESLGHTQDITVTYLHHVLIGKNGPMREKEVLEKVRSYATSQNRALEFLADVAEGANDYAALFNADHPKWNQYGSGTRQHLQIINRDLRVEQIRPLMFAVSRKFNVKETQRAFQLFVYWSVRFLFGGGGGGLLDRNYAQAAEQITSGKIKSADELATHLKDILPSDALFEASFSEARVSAVHLARYYLRALERSRKGLPGPEYIPNDDEQVVNLEHVLPQNPGRSGRISNPK